MSSHKYTPVKTKALIQLGFVKLIRIKTKIFFLLSSCKYKHKKANKLICCNSFIHIYLYRYMSIFVSWFWLSAIYVMVHLWLYIILIVIFTLLCLIWVLNLLTKSHVPPSKWGLFVQNKPLEQGFNTGKQVTKFYNGHKF